MMALKRPKSTLFKSKLKKNAANFTKKMTDFVESLTSESLSCIISLLLR